mmetsp:Transcript_13221/g.20803  ORF Transcript_13221/g.20803 Transcript_13221/m.20803 type:complete len:88 (+) Transcript_13221:106-369(+)
MTRSAFIRPTTTSMLLDRRKGLKEKAHTAMLTLLKVQSSSKESCSRPTIMLQKETPEKYQRQMTKTARGSVTDVIKSMLSPDQSGQR